MKYFQLSEFDCPDCKQNKIDHNFVELLDKARALAGIPFIINSGWRCERHNKIVGGSPTSSHLKGLAADIRCIDSRSRFLMLTALLKIGFNRFVLYETFIHVDDDPSKASSIIQIVKND